MDIKMDPIQVKARFGANGAVSILKFSWAGEDFTVSDTGRQWQAGDGLHVLVMTGGQVYELVLASGEGTWYIIPRTYLTHV